MRIAEERENTEKTTESIAEKTEPVAKNEEGDITKEPTKLVAETIEPVSENNFLVVVAPNLIIREGKNQHPPIWLTDYNSDKGLSKVDEENMAFFDDFR